MRGALPFFFWIGENRPLISFLMRGKTSKKQISYISFELFLNEHGYQYINEPPFIIKDHFGSGTETFISNEEVETEMLIAQCSQIITIYGLSKTIIQLLIELSALVCCKS